FYIRRSHNHAAVETARTQDRRIQDIHPVGSRHHNDSFIDAKTVHFHQKLIQRLFSFIVTAAHTGAPSSGHRVDFIDENDTGAVTLSLFKQIPHPGRSHAHEHFHEIRSGNTKER